MTAVFAGLILVAIGGALFQVRLLIGLGRRWHGAAFAVLDEMDARPWLLWGLHVLCYGLFFGAMLFAFARPSWNLHIQQMVRAAMHEGPGIKHVVSAYQSGDILLAAAMTFAWNYGVATCALTMLPGVAVPFFGALFALLKNLLSFAFAGYILAPLWTGAAEDMTFHCLTVAIELEAYILAVFTVIVVWIAVFKNAKRELVDGRHAAFAVTIGLAVTPILLAALAAMLFALDQPRFGAALLGPAAVIAVTCVYRGKALSPLVSGLLVTGVLLAVAGLYEATTIILLRS